jgi:hypothetical protein
MNIKLILIGLGLGGSTGASAQVMNIREPLFRAGVKVGGHFMRLSSAPVKSAPSPMVGLFAYNNMGRIGVRLEVLGTMVTHTTKYAASYYTMPAPGRDSITEAKLQALYVSVPLLVEYQLTERIQLIAGPQFTYTVSVKDMNDAYTKAYGTVNGKTQFLKKQDYAIVAGAEYQIGANIKVGARIVAGLTDINASTYYLVPRSWSTLAGQLSISYKIL